MSDLLIGIAILGPALLFAAFTAGRIYQSNKEWPKQLEAMREANKYRALYELSGGKPYPAPDSGESE